MFVDFLKRKTFDLLTTNKPNTNRAAILELSNMVILVVLDLVILVEEEKNIFETKLIKFVCTEKSFAKIEQS